MEKILRSATDTKTEHENIQIPIYTRCKSLQNPPSANLGRISEEHGEGVFLKMPGGCDFYDSQMPEKESI